MKKFELDGIVTDILLNGHLNHKQMTWKDETNRDKQTKIGYVFCILYTNVSINITHLETDVSNGYSSVFWL